MATGASRAVARPQLSLRSCSEPRAGLAASFRSSAASPVALGPSDPGGLLPSFPESPRPRLKHGYKPVATIVRKAALSAALDTVSAQYSCMIIAVDDAVESLHVEGKSLSRRISAAVSAGTNPPCDGMGQSRKTPVSTFFKECSRPYPFYWV